MSWNDGLEGAALDIASSINSPLCVVAGPGTGKTFTMMRRITRLIEADGVDPKKILACTFTRTAAKDLEQSISELGVEGAGEIRAQTIHALCFSMLSNQEVFETTGRVPRPLMQFEERFLLEDLKNEGRGGIRECRKRLKAFSAAWARLQHEAPGWPRERQDRSFHAALESWLRFHEAMLIGELIPEAVAYLRDNPYSPYREMFDYVLVDEYQDLNRAEQVLVDLLASNELVIIGDEDQSIYSFKYAHPEGIVEFPDTHDGTETAGLAECRRCPIKVVELANALICNNLTRSCRELAPRDENPDGEVYVIQWRSPEEEAQGIAYYIDSLISTEEIDAGEVLVLTPRRQFGYSIRDELRDLEIPAHSFFSEELLDGDPKILDSSRAQQALSLLILAANREDIVALRCWCGFGNASLNSKAWKRLRTYCEHEDISPWDALEQLLEAEINIPYTTPLVRRFETLLSELDDLEGLTGDELLSAVFPEDDEWTNPFYTFFEEIEEDEITPGQVVEIIKKNITQPELPTDVDYVRIMSLHKSKGLSADLVIVAGCIEGLIPYIDYDLSSEEQEKALEEQRRLFYVAITRTRQILVLSSVTTLPLGDAHTMRVRVQRQNRGRAQTVASRFIRELGDSCPQAITGSQFLEYLE